MADASAGTSTQEHGLSYLYYWILVLTFNLRSWLLFPIEAAYLGLLPGLVGHKCPRRHLGVMERQYMVNIHDKSPVRQALIPLTKHRGSNIIVDKSFKRVMVVCFKRQI